MNLDETMHSVARGDVEALRILYEQLRVPVYALALAILRSKPEAEDVLQETFIRVYERAESYQTGTNPKAWMIAIARNLAYDALRRKKKETTSELKEDITSNDSTILQRLELTEALFRLEHLERQIVVMHAVAGLKHSEISEQLGIPAGTVRWKYRQSLSRLAEIMGGDNNGAKAPYVRAEK